MLQKNKNRHDIISNFVKVLNKNLNKKPNLKDWVLSLFFLKKFIQIFLEFFAVLVSVTFGGATCGTLGAL